MKAKSWSGWLLRKYFVQHQKDGRAVLAGDADAPTMWIARTHGHYCIAFEALDEVLWVPAEASMQKAVSIAMAFRLITRKPWTKKAVAA